MYFDQSNTLGVQKIEQEIAEIKNELLDSVPIYPGSFCKQHNVCQKTDTAARVQFPLPSWPPLQSVGRL